jgi:hypothetical protein
VQRNVSLERVEESNAVANHDRQDGVANFVGQPESKTFGGHHTAANEPDAAELRTQTFIHEWHEIA